MSWYNKDMETLKGYTKTLKFVVPSGLTTATYKVYRNDTQIGGAANATITGTLAEVTLPYAAVADTGTVEVELSFVFQSGSYTQSQTLEVVTPYLEVWEVKEIYPEATDQEAKDVEAAVRHVINAHCGQTFGKTTKTMIVEGHGEKALRLPERLIELTGLSTLSAELDPLAAIIVSDGWYLKKAWSNEVTPIDSDSVYWGFTDADEPAPGEPGYEKPSHGHIIVPPSVGPTPTVWRDDYPFKITGTWGYIAVPSAVIEAAKLLVNDYACSEIAYRDRYLESIKAADWRLQFSSRAWEYTGNVRADQLLSEFVLLDWAVI